MKYIKIIFFLQFINFGFGQNLENELYLNYLAAARNANSTYQYNLVIKFTNLNDKLTREICIDGYQLISALRHENNLDLINDYDKIDSILVSKKDRYFEFKNPLAIKQLLHDAYSESEFKKFQQKNNLEKIAEKIKAEKKIYPEKSHMMYAHALFNLGILTGQNDCMGGFTLDFVDRDNQY